jgi:Fe2+ or Zn2+ uptake regulation protein
MIWPFKRIAANRAAKRERVEAAIRQVLAESDEPLTGYEIIRGLDELGIKLGVVGVYTHIDRMTEAGMIKAVPKVYQVQPRVAYRLSIEHSINNAHPLNYTDLRRDALEQTR